MNCGFLVLLVAAIAGPDEAFPLRTDPPPCEWKTAEMNKTLLHSWEKGTVYVLAWMRIETDWGDHTAVGYRALVLKLIDRPVPPDNYRCVLGVLNHKLGDGGEWGNDMVHFTPVSPAGKPPAVGEWRELGNELHRRLPDDRELQSYLRDARWAACLGTFKGHALLHGKPTIVRWTTAVKAGGVNREQWKKLFGRDVDTSLFHELRKPDADK